MDNDTERKLDLIAEGFVSWPRAPLLHWPDEAGLDFEPVFFPSEDGVPLEGWFIPKAGSDRVVICNHPRWFNRAGLPSHLEPWKSFGASAGNDFEVDFIPDYRLLHDAGYHARGSGRGPFPLLHGRPGRTRPAGRGRGRLPAEASHRH